MHFVDFIPRIVACLLSVMDSLNFNRRINEENYSETALPTHPARVLSVHVAQKGIQGGALAGLFVGVPLVSYLRKLPLRTAWTRAMIPAPVIGAAVTLSMLYALDYSKPMGPDGVDDRAFRIIKNEGQVKVDNYSTVAAAGGAAVGAVSIGGFPAVLAGASTGVALDVVYYMMEKQGLLQKIKDFKLPAPK